VPEQNNVNDADDSDLSIKRRVFLSATAVTATGLAGIGAFGGTAAAWNDLDADFKGCSEVWILVSQRDVDCENPDEIRYDDPHLDAPKNQCPLAVAVVINDGDGTDCVTVETGPNDVETIPGQYGDRPLVKYQAPDGEKILGIVGLSPSRNPLDSQLIPNDHRCTQTPNTPSFESSSCYKDAVGDDEEAVGDDEDGGNGSGEESSDENGEGKGKGGSNGKGKGSGNGKGKDDGNGKGKGKGKGGGNGKGKGKEKGDGNGKGKGKGKDGGNGKGKGKGKGGGNGKGKGKGRTSPVSISSSLWPF